MNFSDHTFVVCAYGNSPYLEECIISLKNQTVKSNIIISTSTESDFIKNIALKYSLPLFINNGKKGIGEDWNFAVSKSETNLVTIAHQDDIYLENYLESVIEKYNDKDNQIIFFTNYNEIIDGERTQNRRNLKIKRLIALNFNNKFLGNIRWFKRRLLSFGCPIGCPSVTLNTKLTGKTPYVVGHKFVLDWMTWEKLAEIKGRYVFIDKYLMLHRRHDDAETTKCMENNTRKEEDIMMLNRFWPKPIASFIEKYFAKS